MVTTIGELISQIRNQAKSVYQRNRYISDRLVYSLIKKHAALFTYREDANMKMSKARYLYTSLPFLELEEVDAVEAKCTGIRSGCIFKRTKEKLPPLMKGYGIPLIGDVTSIDGSEKVTRTNPVQYINKTKNIKYNDTKYYWILNDYLYFPNLEWDAIKVEAVLDAEKTDDCGNIDPCAVAQDIEFNVPQHLLSTIQAEVIKDIAFMLQIPQREKLA